MRFTLVLIRAVLSALVALVTLCAVLAFLWHRDTAGATVWGTFGALLASIVAPHDDDLKMIIYLATEKE